MPSYKVQGLKRKFQNEVDSLKHQFRWLLDMCGFVDANFYRFPDICPAKPTTKRLHIGLTDTASLMALETRRNKGGINIWQLDFSMADHAELAPKYWKKMHFPSGARLFMAYQNHFALVLKFKDHQSAETFLKMLKEWVKLLKCNAHFYRKPYGLRRLIGRENRMKLEEKRREMLGRNNVGHYQ